VLKLFIRAMGFVAALTLSGTVNAVAMGGISVATGLGEPLKAEIELRGIGKTDIHGLSAKLASPEAFKGAGIDYPSYLPGLKFQVKQRANRSFYLQVNSVKPVTESFISLLVALRWPSGKLLREYTFLLDPPDFIPEQPKVAKVKPLAPTTVKKTESKPAEIKVKPKSRHAHAKLDEHLTFPQHTLVAKKTEASLYPESGVVSVKRGDTLSGIVSEVKPPDVSLERMLVASYRANEDAFVAKNMNRLKVGKILHLPEREQLNAVGQGEARKEIRIQTADWHAYRQKLAAASGSVMERMPKQESSGKISTTVADKAPAAKKSAKEVVRLSKGQAPGDNAYGGKKEALQDKVHAMEEESISRNKELENSNVRIAMLEKNIKEMQRLIELKGKFAPPEVVVEPLPEVAIPVKTAAVANVDGSPGNKPVPKTAPVPPPPSLWDEILGEPLYLAGGVVFLLCLLGIGFMASRRRSLADIDMED